MSETVVFSLDKALDLADVLVYEHRGRHLSDIESAVLEGSWKGLTYRHIAEASDYTWEYINCDVAFHLWRDLSDACNEQVKKSNFKRVLDRHQRSRSCPNQPIVSDPAARRTLYVERPPLETECYQELLKPGALLRIKAAKKLGKTCLMDKLLVEVQQQQYLTVSFNLLRLSNGIVQDIDQFLRALCIHVTRKLQLENAVSEYWQMGMGPNSSCTVYFEEHLLPQLDQPLVLALDNVDRLFPHKEVASDFFSMLRAWHEEAKNCELWEKLRLVIVHSTEVYIPLSTDRSPFNVGLSRELPEFNRDQVISLAQQSGLAAPRINEAEIATLMEIVGGHPGLVQTALRQLQFQPQVTLVELMQDAPTDAGIYEDHLRDLLIRLQTEPELVASLRTVMLSDGPVDLPAKHRFLLNRLGLVVFLGNQVVPRNRLYRLYFQQHLGVE